ncbi:hypothetical protein OAA59_01755 [bacterium]|nr:hypothetical protein [bacterium]
MDPLIILLIGMTVVIGGVLWLRLHAFVALIIGALVVGVLATPEAIEQSVMNDKRIEKDIRKQATNRLGQGDPNLTNLVQELHETQAKHTAVQSVISRVTGAFGLACGFVWISISKTMGPKWSNVVRVASIHLLAIFFTINFPIEIYGADEKGGLMKKVTVVVYYVWIQRIAVFH